MSATTIDYQRSAEVRRAYRDGRAAVADRDDANPFIEERQPELYAAWDEGYEDEVHMRAAGQSSQIVVSSRDTYVEAR